MTKNVGVYSTQHIESAVTQLADCVRIERTDGKILSYTSHDQDVTYDGVTYKSAYGINKTDTEYNSDYSVDNLEVVGFIDSAEITESDIRSHRFDNAEVYFFVLNWSDPQQGIIKLKRGWIGNITKVRNSYRAEIRGLTQALQRNLLTYYTAECQNDFGDDNCGFDATSLQQTGTVATVTDSRRVFTAIGISASGSPDDTFDSGKITFTAGSNNGLSMEIKTYTAGGDCTLYLRSPFTIQVGDTFTIIPGCPKSPTACKHYQTNLHNYKGFPHLIGIDELLRLPNAEEVGT